MSETFICWKCNKALQGVILPMSRREECFCCGADQHVCKMCEFYDSRHRGACNEERAESVSDDERANFCDYFKPSTNRFDIADGRKSAIAKAKFAALFGDEPEPSFIFKDNDKDVQDKQEPSEAAPLSPKEIAEQKLRDLLGG